MVDLHPVFAKLLESIAPVELSFPTAKVKYPVITITELGNRVNAVYGGEERLSGHDWQIDIWDNGKTPQKAEKMAVQVNQVLTKKGMRRYFGQLMRDPGGLQRYCMRVRFTLDELTGYVYRS